MRTNSKEIKTSFNIHVLECIDTSEHEQHNETTQKSLQIIVDAFNSEFWHGYNKKNYTRQEAFKNWLRGAPSYLSAFLWFSDVLEFMASIGLEKPKNKDDNEAFELYMNLFFMAFLRLCKSNNINF